MGMQLRARLVHTFFSMENVSISIPRWILSFGDSQGNGKSCSYSTSALHISVSFSVPRWKHKLDTLPPGTMENRPTMDVAKRALKVWVVQLLSLSLYISCFLLLRGTSHGLCKLTILASCGTHQ